MKESSKGGAAPATAGDAARAAACTLGVEARAYFGSRPWLEIERKLAQCWERNYGHLDEWGEVAEVAYSAWSYQRPRMVLVPEPPYGDVSS